MTQLFVDMDGVLADFDQHYLDCFGVECNKLLDNVDWDLIKEWGNFYADIPPMKDMHQLWSYIEGHDPIIITGIPSSKKLMLEAEDNKRQWIRNHFGAAVEQRAICCLSKDKCLHMKAKGDILIDDWEKYRHLWEAAGGRWITHFSADDTIERLKGLGV